MSLRSIFLIVIALAAKPAAQAPKTWLDLPLRVWNQAGVIAPPPAPPEPLAAVINRCKLSPLRDTPAQRALEAAGWIPYLHVDRQLVQGDVEIFAGMTGADGMCRPTGYNVFVFVGGKVAGTLSPVAMTSRLDGSIGAVRLAPDGGIAAEFARYGSNDPLCCPSSHVAVRYHIDRSKQPIVVPTGTPITRR